MWPRHILGLGFLRKTLYQDFKELISGVARTATAEIGYNDRGKWSRIGNLRYQTAAKIIMIRANSARLGLLELMKSDGIRGVRSAALYCGESVVKA